MNRAASRIEPSHSIVGMEGASRGKKPRINHQGPLLWRPSSRTGLIRFQKWPWKGPQRRPLKRKHSVGSICALSQWSKYPIGGIASGRARRIAELSTASAIPPASCTEFGVTWRREKLKTGTLGLTDAHRLSAWSCHSRSLRRDWERSKSGRSRWSFTWVLARDVVTTSRPGVGSVDRAGAGTDFRLVFASARAPRREKLPAMVGNRCSFRCQRARVDSCFGSVRIRFGESRPWECAI